MYNKRNIVALIPARGGSKGVPRKNIRNLLGKPLIAYSIIQCQRSLYIDRVIVSTEDDEIAKVARDFDAEVPFIRPSTLATDNAKGLEVVFHAVNWFRERAQQVDIIVVLPPTSPLRLTADIDNAIELFFEKSADAVVSVCLAEKNLYWSNILPDDGCMKDFVSNNAFNKNRQEFQKIFSLNGSIYVANANFLLSQKTYYSEKSYAYIMPPERSIDIDTEIDFQLAEYLMQKNEENRRL